MRVKQLPWSAKIAGLLALAVLAAAPSRLFATSSVLGTWESVYSGSTLGATYSCTICHTKAPTFNPYGQAVFDAWSGMGGTGTADAAIRSIEPLDSDGDGYSNIAEISANTLPGDPTSHPTGDTTPPSAPTNPNATPISSTEIDLTWSASIDNVGVVGYKVYRNSAVVGQPTTTSYPDTGLAPGTAYQYYVTALDAASNESAPSSTVPASTPAALTLDATVGSITIPAVMIRKSTTAATVVMTNAGSQPWTAAGNIALASQNPADSSTWGLNRVALAPTDSIAAGQQKTFSFQITAPDVAGTYSCDWQMVQDGAAGSFGAIATTAVAVTSFEDVGPTYWAWPQIEAVVAANIANGYNMSGHPMYQPIDVVTRDQMAVFISRALAKGDANVPAGPATPHFSDVPTSYWAYKYVEYAYSAGVVQGYSDGTYKPTDQLDRGQMAVFLARSIATPVGEAGLTGYIPPAAPSFPDVATTFWAYKYIEYVKQTGVANGYPDGTYHPEYFCTRDQMAVYVARAFRLPM